MAVVSDGEGTSDNGGSSRGRDQPQRQSGVSAGERRPATGQPTYTIKRTDARDLNFRILKSVDCSSNEYGTSKPPIERKNSQPKDMTATSSASRGRRYSMGSASPLNTQALNSLNRIQRSSPTKFFSDSGAGPSSTPAREVPRTLDSVEAETLLLQYGVHRKMWAVPQMVSNGLLCNIQHDLFRSKNIEIPLKRGIFLTYPVKFPYNPSEKTAHYVMLLCDCMIAPYRGVSNNPVPHLNYASFFYGEDICINGKVYLVKGASGPNSFFVFTFDPRKLAYNVLAHIVSDSG